jgi:Mg2+ and Co2+ transporter CorA
MPKRRPVGRPASQRTTEIRLLKQIDHKLDRLFRHLRHIGQEVEEIENIEDAESSDSPRINLTAVLTKDGAP